MAGGSCPLFPEVFPNKVVPIASRSFVPKLFLWFMVLLRSSSSSKGSQRFQHGGSSALSDAGHCSPCRELRAQWGWGHGRGSPCWGLEQHHEHSSIPQLLTAWGFLQEGHQWQQKATWETRVVLWPCVAVL